MSPCDEYSRRVLSYLENRLRGQELDDFRTHLEDCSNCRSKVEAERSLSQLLRRSRPLYSAPPALRARVAAAVEQHADADPALANGGFYEGLLRMLGSGWADPARRVARLRLLAVSLAVIAIYLSRLSRVSYARCAPQTTWKQRWPLTAAAWMAIFLSNYTRTLQSR